MFEYVSFQAVCSRYVRSIFVHSGAYTGTFHKAYLVTLSYLRASNSSHPTYDKVIFRAARRFMPRLKTSSEVATLKYLREHTNVPVPEVYAWDSNPYSRVGGEWILMSRVSPTYINLCSDIHSSLLLLVFYDVLSPIFSTSVSPNGAETYMHTTMLSSLSKDAASPVHFSYALHHSLHAPPFSIKRSNVRFRI